MASWKYEKTATLGTVELDTGYTAASGTMVLVAGQGARLPSAGDFWLAWSTDYTDPFATIHLFKVTARSTDTLTVTAETTEGGGDTNINAGQKLKAVMSISALDQLRQDICQTGALGSAAAEKAGALYFANDAPVILRDTGAAFAYFGPIYPHSGVPLAGWTFANQDSATQIAANGIIGINKLSAGTASAFTWLYRTAPSTPYTIDAHFNVMMSAEASAGDQMGSMFAFSDSVSGRYHGLLLQLAGSMGIIIDKWNTASTDAGGTDVLETSSSVLGQQWPFMHGSFWARLTYDGSTTITFGLSVDGYNYRTVYSTTPTHYLTNAPDRIAFGARGNNTLVTIDAYRVS